MSVSIYDTAWLAMITKIENGKTLWLFPESFELLLHEQMPNGRWQAYDSDIDAILNTMAGLLASIKHQTHPATIGVETPPTDLESRIGKARSQVETMLQSWDVMSTRNVGFEIIVPALLGYLNQNGRVDFDRISHHVHGGSMMASPSSTAAYLINTTTWDDEAESYLRGVVRNCKSNRAGGVPCAFPTSIFETAWALSTLLTTGHTFNSLGEENVQTIANFLEKALKVGHGVVGFGKFTEVSSSSERLSVLKLSAPGIMADADDSAKVQLCLSLLGRTSSFSTQMIAKFDRGTHFQTYPAERDPSVSTNCNVLMALLHCENPDFHRKSICNATNFLCHAWENGISDDKWLYVYMLQGQTFVKLLRRWDEGYIKTLPKPLIHARVPTVLVQILHRTLLLQMPDGSWGHSSYEPTAYAILTLISISSLPWFDVVQDSITRAVISGQQYLASRKDKTSNPSYVWIEKVTYSMPAVSQAYYIAAQTHDHCPLSWTPAVQSLISPSSTSVKLPRFFLSLPLFADGLCSEELLALSLVEACSLASRMRMAELEIFPHTNNATEDYLEYIPFITTSCSYLGKPINTQTLLDLILLSSLNYQIDHYMETVVGALAADEIESARSFIYHVCHQNFQQQPNRKRPYEESFESLPGTSQNEVCFANVKHVLSRFVQYVLNHPNVLQSSASLRRHLSHELQTFLLAHIQQIEDNRRRAARKTNGATHAAMPERTYFDWVTGTSADHTSCPYSFVFWTCLISQPGQSCFASAKAKYLSQDMSRHLATMCRQYNDYGSVARDYKERNLNSVDFEEFQQDIPSEEPWLRTQGPSKKTTSKIHSSISQRKKCLLDIAAYERRNLEHSLETLAEECSEHTMNAVRCFVRVTDLYGQIYVAKDIGIQAQAKN
ncbi:MAG: hypothetical protein Q9202_001904 [Teloschistes flavicans]